MNLLVLGAGGMAGHMATLFLREAGHTVDTLAASHPFDKQTYLVDVTDRRALDAFLDGHEYDAVVNCIGLLVAPSEERKDLAVYLNSYLPHLLEQRYAVTKTRVIHLGTDGVFSGTAAEYTEDALCDGTTFYGRSKALGELDNSKDTTIRMSIVGPTLRADGAGLFNWFMQQTGEVRGYTNALWHGVTTLELAKTIDFVLTHGITGVCHLAPGEGISKYDLLCLLQATFDRPVQVQAAEGPSINTKLISTRADFPTLTLGYADMVRDLAAWIPAHKELYGHYQA